MMYGRSRLSCDDILDMVTEERKSRKRSISIVFC